ncbi:MAG TPA: tetratricopeptide repeat protein [Armatimonadetes bacterium]|nr:tetratricopeptide repeat protein [Armatimonadota bacterium]
MSPPLVLRLLEKGIKAIKREQYDRAETLLRQALAQEPRLKQAYNNLGVAYLNQGKREQARECFQRALEIDPLYIFPRCNLARLHIYQDHLEEAEELLKPLAEVEAFHPDELSIYYTTLGELALAQGDYEAARRYVEMLLSFVPKDKRAQSLLARIDYLESLQASLEQWRRDNRRQRERKDSQPLAGDADLQECLARYTRDALRGVCNAVNLTGVSALRKAEVIRELAAWLSQEAVLKQVIATLQPKEQEALREILRQQGVIPWQTFAARWGQDWEESPYWQWHQPKTLMGRLRVRGLLQVGLVDDQLAVLVPQELRLPLRKILKV